MCAWKPSLADEFADVSLADERLNRRLALIVDALEEDPALSFPEALGRGSALEAGYRFFNNHRVDPRSMLEPHVAATSARLHGRDRVLCVHDTTEFSFRTPREGLEGNVFRGHFSLMVSADGKREPLGLAELHTWVRPQKKGKRTSEARKQEAGLESERWLRQSLAVEDEFHEAVLIHVEDREADIYGTLATRKARGMHFIVRAQSYRNVVVDDENRNIRDYMREQPALFERTVRLSRRDKPKAPRSSHQARDGREARLAFAAASVRIQRPRRDKDLGPPLLQVNMVHVIEMDAPDGEEPVEWLLMTTEPIDDPAQVEFIVDSYRARWVIEEYFKALKTGCSFEVRQLESYDALRRALAIFAVIAWRLLWMRFLARNADPIDAADVVRPSEIAILQAQGRIGANPTMTEFLAAVAALGGHIKNNGPPGWLTLWRGYKSLSNFARGYEIALQLRRCDQS